MRRAPARPMINDSETLIRVAIGSGSDASGRQRRRRRRSFDPERGEEARSWPLMLPLNFLRALDPLVL